MDKLLIIDIMLNSALITILLFGAYLVLKQLHPSKIKIIFLVFAVVRSILFFMMLMDQVARANSGEGEASPLNYYSIVYSVISHPFLIFLFYNLIFSLKTSAKIVAIHIAIFLSIFGAIWICDYYSPESRFDNFSSIEGAYSNIESPLMILKICMLFVQLTFSLIVFVVVSKLVPIYQNYIEKTSLIVPITGYGLGRYVI